MRVATMILFCLFAAAACSSAQLTRPLASYVGNTRAELEADIGRTSDTRVDPAGRTILAYRIDLGPGADPHAAIVGEPCHPDGPVLRGEDRLRLGRCSTPSPAPVQPNAESLVCPVEFAVNDEGEIETVEVRRGECRRHNS